MTTQRRPAGPIPPHWRTIRIATAVTAAAASAFFLGRGTAAPATESGTMPAPAAGPPPSGDCTLRTDLLGGPDALFYVAADMECAHPHAVVAVHAFLEQRLPGRRWAEADRGPASDSPLNGYAIGGRGTDPSVSIQLRHCTPGIQVREVAVGSTTDRPAGAHGDVGGNVLQATSPARPELC